MMWLSVVVFVITGLVAWSWFRPNQLLSAELQDALRSGAQVIDVRTPAEFSVGAAPGAVNIPVDQLTRRLHELDRGRPVVVYCASGWRSAHAARQLKQAGFERVVDAGSADMLSVSADDT